MNGCVIEVKVQPGASRTEVAGRWGEYPKIRISSRPVDGAANEELVRFLSKLLGIPRSDIDIASGHSGRLKRLKIAGLSREEVESRLYNRSGSE